FFDWGDGTNSGWTGFVQPGIPVNASHTWTVQGNYIIKVKAKDVYDAESEWSTLEVWRPKTYIHNPIIELIMELLGCFPLFEKLLNQILI
ncbi:MAG: Zn-dependent exopeptidase M28, partial [Promethearchaeota archaeon]